jgi:hypothetical protein
MIDNAKTRIKYIRRLNMLKDLIMKSNDKLIFIYSSQSSLESGNFMIDNRIVIKNVYYYLTKIYELINVYNKNNKMILFDSILNEDREKLHKNIILYKMKSCKCFLGLLHQILQKDKEIFE